MNNLKKENKILKNKNNDLESKNNSLENQLNSKIKIIKNYENELKNIKNTLSVKDNNIFNLNNQINNLNSQINDLKLKNNKIKVKFGFDEIVTVLIKSIDQKVDTALTIQKSELFVRLEEQLYDEYPEYKDLDNIYFTVNGNKIKRFRTIQENNLKNKDKILLNNYDI